MKERCYERGAEDNLTVVIVRVGTRITAEQRLADLEPTITPETQPILKPGGDTNQTVLGSKPESTLIAPSRIAFPGNAGTAAAAAGSQETLNVADPKAKKGGGGAAKAFFLLLLPLLIVGGFVAGARYKDRVPFLAAQNPKTSEPVVPTKTEEEPFVQFEKARREVDRDPRAWLASDIGKELLKSGVQNPLDSPDPEFLYLYGRANLLTGNSEEAAKAFDAAITKAGANATGATDTIKKEATLGLAALSIKSLKDREKALRLYDELTKPPATQTAP
jgi:tetratricopeptide (TPR) repeat protein